MKGDSITLEKNPDYWGSAVALDKATFKIVPDASAQLASLMAGDVDAYPIFFRTGNAAAAGSRWPL